MRKYRSAGVLAAVALLSVGCGRQQTVEAQNATSVPGMAAGIKLASPEPNGDWEMPAGDYANTRFSQLSQINAAM